MPDLGEDHGNVHFVSPVVRDITRTREEVRAGLGIAKDQKMILLSASGSGIGGFLLDRVVRAVGSLSVPDLSAGGHGPLGRIRRGNGCDTSGSSGTTRTSWRPRTW